MTLQNGFDKQKKSHLVVRVACVAGLEGAQLLLTGLGGCLRSQSSLQHWGRLWWQGRGRIQAARVQVLELGEHPAARVIHIRLLGGN